jgi:ABC-2 type transport system ATP-binding protein
LPSHKQNGFSNSGSDSRGSTAALAVDHISKRFATRSLFGFGGKKTGETQALSDVSFAVQPGEMVGLLGPNGAGKTTLLKIISSLLYPDSGQVRVAGHDVFKHGRRRLGLISCDERSFYWRLSGIQNLEFFAALFGIPRARANRKISDLLDALGLTYAADKPYQSYSSGMKQKLAIVRGLMSDPDLILYDEPTRSLDPLSTQNIREWIRMNRLHSPSQTHVLATNQLHEAEQLCDRVLIIKRGRLIAHGTIAEIRKTWLGGDFVVYKIEFSGSLPEDRLTAAPSEGLLEVEPVLEGEESGVRIRSTADGRGLSRTLSILLSAGLSIKKCEREEVPFDEVFCSLVSSENRVEAEVTS